jgi:hypothetical protein
MLSLEGLLRVVEVVARIQAEQALAEQEGGTCLSQLSPPVYQFDSPTFVGESACSQPQTLGLDTEPNAGEPNGDCNSQGAGQ